MNNYGSDHLELNSSPDKFMQLSMASTNYSSTYKNPTSQDIFPEAETLRIFELTRSDFSKNYNELARTQDKVGFKKMTKRPIYQQKSKNGPKKSFMNENHLQLHKSRNTEQKSSMGNHKKDASVQQLEIRCMELDEELKKLKLKQRRTTTNLHKTAKRDNQYLNKALLTIESYAKKMTIEGTQSNQNKKEAAQQYIQCMSVKSNYRNSIEDKSEQNSHFFNKLKKKLNQEMEKIKEKKEEIQPREILAGCELKKNNHSSSRDAFRTPVTDRNKSKTAITRSGVQTSSRDSVKRKRPQSSRQRILQSRQLSFKIEKIKEQDNLELRGKKIEAKRPKSAKTLSNIRNSEPQINKTFRHISPLYKQNNWTTTKREVEQQKIKQKMLNILIDCQGETSRKETIEEGIKVFEAYSRKMSRNLAKKSKLLNNIRNTQTFEDNEADQEYH